jgi:hypothetical protein
MSSTIKHATADITAGTVAHQERVVTSSKARMVLAVERIIIGFTFIVGLRRKVVGPRSRHPA